MGEEEYIVRRGLVKKHAAVDYEVWQWKTNLEQSRGAKRVIKAEVQAFAMEAYKRAGITDFKASDGWYRRWRVRWQQPGIVRVKEATVKEEKAYVKLSAQTFIKINEKKSIKAESLNNEEQNEQNQSEENNRKMSKRCSNFAKSHQHSKTLEQKLLSLSKNIKRNQSELDLKGKDTNEEDSTIFPKHLGLVRVQNRSLTQCETLRPDLDSLFLNINVPINKKIHEKQSSLSDVNLSLGSTHDLTKNMKESSHSPNCYNVVINKRSNLNKSVNNESQNIDVSDAQQPVNKVDFNTVETPLLELASSGVRIMQTITPQEVHRESSSNFDSHEQNDSEMKLLNEESETLWACSPMQNDIKCKSQKEVFLCSQSDSGISLPSTSASASLDTSYSITSPTLMDQNDLDFNDHELFCDSCEDFHPRHNSVHALCCKQKRVIADNFLLSCVFEKKDLIVVKDPSSSSGDKSRMDEAEKITDNRETKDMRLKNPNIELPKGKRYLVHFKSKVVNYALNHNLKQAADKFRVNRNTVTEWLGERKRFSGSDSPKPSVNEMSLMAADSEFLSWLEQSKFNLTNELIKQKASEWLLSEHSSNKKCQWLHMYAHRLSGFKDSTISKRYIAYPEAFKRAAVFHAQTHSNMAAARVFGVARRRIIEWLGSSSVTGKKSESNVASNVTDEGVDRQVFEWYNSQKPLPSSKQVRCKARELYRAAGYHSIQCGSQWYYRWRARHKLPAPRSELYSDTRLLSWMLAQLDNNQCVTHSALAAQAVTLGHSKVSRGWTFRLCKKYYSLLQTLPEPNTALPSDLERQVLDFRQTLQEVMAKHDFTDVNVVAMDEVPLHFLPRDHNKKPLLVRRPGFESCQATLMVSCLSDGTLLPSMFIFKGSAPMCKSDPRVLSAISETGLATEEVMKQWLTHVCVNQLSGSGILVTDCYDIHTTMDVKQSLTDHHIHQALIPAGCAFRLLPVSKVCTLFKTMLEEMCHLSLANQTAALQSPSHDQLYHWAVRVHKHLAKHQKENIKSAFKETLFQSSSYTSS